MGLKNIEISLDGASIRILNVNPSSPNAPEFYNTSNIKSVVPIYTPGIGAYQSDTDNPLMPYHRTDKLVISINFIDQANSAPIYFDIQDVSNQPTWTHDLAGLIQAAEDINSWISTITVSVTSDEEFNGYYLVDSVGNYVWVQIDSVNGVKSYSYTEYPGGPGYAPSFPLFPITSPSATQSITGISEGILSVDGTVNFTFDADAVIVENFGLTTITCNINGVLGGVFTVEPNMFKAFTHEVATMSSISITGISGGDVVVNYSKGK